MCMLIYMDLCADDYRLFVLVHIDLYVDVYGCACFLWMCMSMYVDLYVDVYGFVCRFLSM